MFMRSLTVLVTVSTSLLFNLGANAQTPAPDPQRIRALVAEQHGRHGTCDVLAEVDDADAVQCAGHDVLLRKRMRRGL